VSGKTETGTREWSVASANCLLGCSHNCRYCYAREMALRFGRIGSIEEWAKPRVNPATAKKSWGRIEGGPVMFPTSHDLLPAFLDECQETIRRILRAGNRLLLVSKPHLQVVTHLCAWMMTLRPDLAGFDLREQVQWRFTIGAMDNATLAYWEPGAPGFGERVASLQRAYRYGFSTSLSIEPMLDSSHVVELVERLDPWVSGEIWIGPMNQVRRRVVPGTDPEEIARIEAGQTPEKLWRIYDALKAHPQVRWKDGFRRILGQEGSQESGVRSRNA